MTILAPSAEIAAQLLNDIKVTSVRLDHGGDYPQVGFQMRYRTYADGSAESVDVYLNNDGTHSVFYVGSEQLGLDATWSLYDLAVVAGDYAPEGQITSAQLDKVITRFNLVIAQTVAVIKGVLGGQVTIEGNDPALEMHIDATLAEQRELILTVANS